ncbi:MAG: hypothetical protein IJ496_10295 [Ruminococcus sp.]|nr:hypothetical protein [Ruminococcus sp.]
MFEKKKNYAQGEMRPLSALSQKKPEEAVSKRTVPARVPVSPQVQNTVSALSGQNKITEGDTAQRTPIRAAAGNQPAVSAGERKTEAQEHYTSPDVQSPPPARNPMLRSDPRRWSRSERGEREPDLSRWEEREAFFSQCLSEETCRSSPASSAAGPAQKEETQSLSFASSWSTNPFRNRPADRPVISHAKEEPEPVPAASDQPLAEEQQPVDAPPADMAMSIEQAFSAKRRRDEKNNTPAPPSPEETQARRRSAYIRAIVLMGILAVGGLFLLLGNRSVFSDEGNGETACWPEFTVQSCLNGEYTSSLSDYYYNTLPMRSHFENAADALDGLKGIGAE